MNLSSPNQIVVMGVSGAGKSLIGSMLADQSGLQFIDGDDLHPKQNIEKMARGVPLQDEDRWPWLDMCGEALNNSSGAVLACSALKRVYRDRIRSVAEGAFFIQLTGDKELLLERMRNREHFMRPEMLDSQLATLEPITDEEGFILDVSAAETELVSEAIKRLVSYEKTL